MKKISLILICILTLVCSLCVVPASAAPVDPTVADNFVNIRGSWVIDEEDGYTVIKQDDWIPSATSYRRMYAYKDAFEDFELSFDMRLDSTASAEAWAGVGFLKGKQNLVMEEGGYLLALKGYGRLCLYNWSQTKELAYYMIPGEDAEQHGWHRYRIQAAEGILKISVDGEIVMEVEDNSFVRGFWSLNAGDSCCSYRSIDVSGTVVDMTVKDYPNDGGYSEEQLEDALGKFEENIAGNLDPYGDRNLTEGGASKAVHSFLEDTLIFIGKHYPASYTQLFVAGIVLALLFSALAAWYIRKIVIIKRRLGGKGHEE